jgi:hypothetical protein
MYIMIQEESKAILRGETDVFQTRSRAEIRNYRRMYLVVYRSAEVNTYVKYKGFWVRMSQEG